MKYCILTFRSVTFAQRGESALRKAGIDCSLIRTPKNLSSRGCGYSLRLKERDANEAVERLHGDGIAFGKLYTVHPDGTAQEWQT